MSDTKIELNILSIVIGVLIARIIWIWMNTSGLYVQSMVCIDPDDCLEDRKDALEQLPGTIVATAITLLIISVIIAGYSD